MVRPEGATEYRMNFASVVAQNESVQLRSVTTGPYFRVVSRFDLAPLQGASLGGPVPGVETLIFIHNAMKGQVREVGSIWRSRGGERKLVTECGWQSQRCSSLRSLC